MFFIYYMFMHSSSYKHVRLSLKPFAEPFAKALAEALQHIVATIRYAPLKLRNSETIKISICTFLAKYLYI